jgi:hypothetical protein
MMSDATNLTPEQLDHLRVSAYAERSPFIDPAAFRAVREAQFYSEWATAILGHPYKGWNHVEPWEITLLALALKAEPDRPVPAAEVARQEQRRVEREAINLAAAKAYQAELDVWHALRDRLPISVTVGHNWTLGHYDGYVTGREHIVAQEDLAIGRLHRKAKQVFCETPSKTASGTRNKDPLRGVDRHNDGEDRIPTCKPCLRIAERIAKGES